MAAIVPQYRRWLAVSCNHSRMADPLALEMVLNFKRAYKPEVTIHLGDFWDMAALRGGAPGTKDEGEDIGLDIEEGNQFLRRLEPTQIFLGNHEDRILRYIGHPNAVAAYAAGKMYSELGDLARELHAPIIQYDLEDGWRKHGDTLFGHGYMYNQSAIRDHAEVKGKCVFGHLHRVGMENGRRDGHVTGYCVGYLGDKQHFGYAKTQRSRMAWSQGFAWGEFSDKHTIVRLEQLGPLWRSPL